jgi:hypothetical protein
MAAMLQALRVEAVSTTLGKPRVVNAIVFYDSNPDFIEFGSGSVVGPGVAYAHSYMVVALSVETDNTVKANYSDFSVRTIRKPMYGRCASLS